ncbi:unnamed protein product [Chondrus crispus]|uniref:PNPLA domain-containing protein n=1 Tax=Chondrus crispus TaxID=2769 RepID=R7QSI8_CHOCR|nr:unnamed protein product [Chondrus crispus]CDF40708.1 unnamed protein product [Chondrus crispus]|eukprot:XP_005711002.1 unnamed protein product [Chondrus crispus]
MFWLVYVFLALVARITGFGRRIKRRRLAFHVRRSWLAQLEDAECYSAWYAAAEALDHVEANSRWKAGDIRAAGVMNGLCARCADTWNSPALQRKRAKHGSDVTDRIESVVNLDMLTAKLNELAVLYKQGDIRGLAFSLRASLIRNLGGMCHPELHEYSRVGTNQIVEDYVNVTSYLLAYIAQSQSQQTGLYSRRESPVLSTSAPISGVGAMNELQLDPRDQRWNERSNSLSKRIMIAPDTSTVHESDAPPLLSVHDKLTFFNEARHAYGRTALMLSGGAAMGLSHMGVVKALLNQGLLPRVVCGTSAGALVASMVGIFDDDELASIFSTESLINPITKVPLSFRFFDDHTTVLRRIRRFLRKGYIQDVRMLQDCLRRNFGDLTFEEAYMKTRRILNITVCPLRSSSDPPLLLNYLTAPHVLIWSAASASCALPLVFAPVELVTKSANGRLVPYHPDGVRWIDGSISSDVPLSRIGELFNVNHFIVSQTNPHVIPRSMPILNTRFAMLVKSEFQFRYWQLLQMGMVPKLLTAIFPHFMQPYAGDVTIMPDVRLSDLTKLLRNPTSESVHGSIRRGEIQTFPFLDRIRLHCLIEQTLDRSVESVATAAKGDETPLSSSSPRRGSALFGRVPSWLWLDTRSILSSSAMKAVASRFTKRGERGDEEEIVELDDDYEEGASEASSDDVMVAKRRRGNRVRKLCGPDSADVTLDGILMELSRETLSGEPLPDPVEYHFPGLADDSEGSAEDERPMC